MDKEHCWYCNGWYRLGHLNAKGQCKLKETIDRKHAEAALRQIHRAIGDLPRPNPAR